MPKENLRVIEDIIKSVGSHHKAFPEDTLKHNEYEDFNIDVESSTDDEILEIRTPVMATFPTVSLSLLPSPSSSI